MKPTRRSNGPTKITATGVTISQETTDQLISKTSNFLYKVIGEPVELASGLLSDSIRAFRAKRLYKLQQEYEAYIVENRIEDQSVPLPTGLALQVLDYASREDEDIIIRLWAGLLAEAKQTESNTKLTKHYIEILNYLDGNDINALAIVMNNGPCSGSGFSVSMDEWLGSREQLTSSFTKLIRLGLISPDVSTKHGQPADGTVEGRMRLAIRAMSGNLPDRQFNAFTLSDFGHDLLFACGAWVDVRMMPVERRPSPQQDSKLQPDIPNAPKRQRRPRARPVGKRTETSE